LVHYLSLPALGYVVEPMKGYSLGGPTTPGFEPIERLRVELPTNLAIIYLRNRYGANHEWTIPLPERGDDFIYPRTKERREEERWKISPIYVYKPRQVPSETAEETRRRYLRRFWPTTAAIARAAQLAEVGRPKEAEIVLRQILQGSPSNHSARYQLGLLMEGREDWDGAKAEYAKIPLGAPEYWQAMSQSAMIEMSLENFEAADRAFKDAIAAFLKLPRQDPRPLATLYVRWAIGDLERQAWESAEQKLRQATVLDPNFPVAFRELGLVQLNVSKLAESRSSLQKALELDREDSLSHFYLASVLARLEEWDSARAEFVETLKIDPENWNAQQGLCESLLRLKRFEESAQECDDALSRLPKVEESRRALLLITLADAQRGKGDWSSAIVTLRRAVDVERETKMAANHLAWLLATSPIDEWRNGEEAVQLLEEFAAHPETPPAYLDTLAAAYAETGKWEKAVSTIQRAIDRLRQEGGSALLGDFEKRLANYQRQEPYRDQTPP
jgi:tetratricopeptide (TPR) repeat protein